MKYLFNGLVKISFSYLFIANNHTETEYTTTISITAISKDQRLLILKNTFIAMHNIIVGIKLGIIDMIFSKIHHI